MKTRLGCSCYCLNGLRQHCRKHSRGTVQIKYSTQHLWQPLDPSCLNPTILSPPLVFSLNYSPPPSHTPSLSQSYQSLLSRGHKLLHLPGHWLSYPFAFLVDPHNGEFLLVMEQNEQQVNSSTWAGPLTRFMVTLGKSLYLSGPHLTQLQNEYLT